MNSASRQSSHTSRAGTMGNRAIVRSVETRHSARRRRRPSPPSKDLNELSSFEKIVSVCVAPAAKAFEYLDETAIYSHDFIERQDRDALCLLALAEGTLGLCVGSIIWCLLKGIALALRKVQRPKYYPKERMRRQALARERRRIHRRTTINDAPTADELLDQWAKVKKNPVEMIRFGSMLCDLEAYVDNSLLRNENGEIVGRNPGIRGWLNANCQPLAVRYKTVMGYKAMAEKFRQAVGLADPYPASLALEQVDDEVNSKNTVRRANSGSPKEDGEGGKGNCQNMVRKSDNAASVEHGQTEGKVNCQNMVRKECENGPGANQRNARRESVEARVARGMACRKARRKAEEMLAECGRSQRGIRLALAARLAPNQVPPEVELEERRRQGLPTRDGLARRFGQMMA